LWKTTWNPYEKKKYETSSYRNTFELLTIKNSPNFTFN